MALCVGDYFVTRSTLSADKRCCAFYSAPMYRLASLIEALINPDHKALLLLSPSVLYALVTR